MSCTFRRSSLCIECEHPLRAISHESRRQLPQRSSLSFHRFVILGFVLVWVMYNSLTVRQSSCPFNFESCIGGKPSNVNVF